MFNKCFDGVLGNMSKAGKEEWRRTFERAFREARKGKPLEQALLEASTKTADLLAKGAAKKALDARLQIAAAQRFQGYADGQRPLHATVLESLRNWLASNPALGRAGVQSIDNRAAALMRTYQQTYLKALDAVGEGAFTFTEKADRFEKFLRAVFGEDVGDAKLMDAARAWNDMNKGLWSEFQAVGGKGEALERYFPQSSDAERLMWPQRGVKDAKGERWTKFIGPLLDRARYKNLDGTPMSDAEFEEFLSHAFDTLVTGGAYKGTRPELRGLTGRHAAARQLHFKDAPSWLAYHRQYGRSSPFDMMGSHIRRMTMDIALLEGLGPNARGQLEAIIEAEAERLGSVRANELAPLFRLQSMEVRNLYEYMAGNIERQPPATTALGRAVQKGFDTAYHLARGLLGMSGISSATDWATMLATSYAWHGKPLAALRDTFKAMDLARKQHLKDGRYKLWIQNSGIAADVFRDTLGRFSGEFSSDSWAARVSDWQMRLTLLPYFTRVRKQAWNTIVSNNIGKMTRDLPWGRLNKNDHRVLMHYGIDEATWDIWRLADTRAEGFGETLLDVNAIDAIPDNKLPALGDPAKAKRDAKLALLAVIHGEEQMAVVEPGTRQRAAFAKVGQMPYGAGYFATAFLQFKQFPFAVLVNHMNRALSLPGKQRGAYLAGLAVTATMLGAYVVQAQNVLKGKDMQEMDPSTEAGRKFWANAFIKGGTLGIFGDFVYGTQTQNDQSPVEVLLGPIGGYLTQAAETMVASAHGEWEEASKHAIKLARDITPTTKLFYLRAAWDHYVFDQLQEASNPGYLARMQQRAYSRYGTQWWWEPGTAAPQRAPEMSESPE